MGANDVDLPQVALDDQRLFGRMLRLAENIAVRIGGKRGSPELELTFHAGPVDRGDEQTVGNCVASHHRLPGVMLGGTELFLLVGQPADGRGIEEDLRSGESE